MVPLTQKSQLSTLPHPKWHLQTNTDHSTCNICACDAAEIGGGGNGSGVYLEAACEMTIPQDVLADNSG